MDLTVPTHASVVGGAKGHTLEAVCKQTPGLPVERCVLQDLPEVIEVARGMAAAGNPGLEMVGMDFFEEQPVKGKFASVVRTIEGFNGIADSAGLKASGVHKAPFGDFTMIEYEKA